MPWHWFHSSSVLAFTPAPMILSSLSSGNVVAPLDLSMVKVDQFGWSTRPHFSPNLEEFLALNNHGNNWKEVHDEEDSTGFKWSRDSSTAKGEEPVAGIEFGIAATAVRGNTSCSFD